MSTPGRFDRGVHTAMKAFSAEEKGRIEDAHRSGEPLMCPRCDVRLDERRVPPSQLVSYVRRRLVVVCPSCRAHLVLDQMISR